MAYFGEDEKSLYTMAFLPLAKVEDSIVFF
jgi:hypothetical protein